MACSSHPAIEIIEDFDVTLPDDIKIVIKDIKMMHCSKCGEITFLLK